MSQPIEQVLHRHERELLARRNVTSVGIGDAGGQPVIIVFVREKVPRDSLPPEDILPARIEDYPVQVQQQLLIG